MTEYQKQQLDVIKNLKPGWFGELRGDRIDPISIEYSEKLLNLLSPNFEVFPLSDGFIQIECDKDNKYIEISIQPDKFEVYWQIIEDQNIIICEGEDVFNYIDNSTFDLVVNFVNLLLNEL